MKIKRSELLASLAAVQPGLAGCKSVIEQSQSFVFSNGRVATFNDEIAVGHPVNLDISGAVLAAPLYKLLSKMKDDEVVAEIKDGEMRFKGARSSAGIRMEADVLLPLGELGEVQEWWELPPKFTDAIRLCLFSASSDMSKPVLCCIHANGEYVESCDNYRLTRCKVDNLGTELLIPANAARSLVGYPVNAFGLTEGWQHYRTDANVVFSCRSMADQYPVLEGFLNVTGNQIKLPKELHEVLDRAAVFTQSDVVAENRVKVAIDSGKISVTGQGAEGWFRENIVTEYKGQAIAFEINPGFLQDCIGLVDTAIVGERMLKMQGQNFAHVLRLLDPQEAAQ